MINVGLAQLKPEGGIVEYIEGEGHSPYTGPKTVYVERRIPEELAGIVESLIDAFLEDNGYNPDAI